MDVMTETLARAEVFGTLQRPKIDWLSLCAQELLVRPGQPIIRPGEPVDAVFVVQVGLVGLFVEHPNRGPSPVQVLGPRQVFGLTALLEDSRLPISVRSLTPARLVKIPVADLRKAVFDDAAAVISVYQELYRLSLSWLHATTQFLAAEAPVLTRESACPFGIDARLTLIISPSASQVFGSCRLMGVCAIGKETGCILASASGGSVPELWPPPRTT